MTLPTPRAGSLALVTLLVLLQPAAAGDKAEAALEKALARIDDSKAADAVRQELLALRRDFPGTPQAVKAAVALAKVPSPLDKLDAGKIPPLERFDWQPKELVAVLHEHRGRHGSRVYTVNVTPDGKLLAVGCADGLVYFWDISATPAKKLSHLNTSNRGVSSVVFSPGAKRLGIGTGDGHIHVWDGPWDKPPPLPATSYIGPTQSVYVAFAPDGKTLAAGFMDGDLKICDPMVEPIKIKANLQAHANGVRAVAFDPTAREQPLLVSAGMDGKLCFWRLGAAKPRLESVHVTKNGAIHALDITADGKTLAYSEGDNTVHLMSMKARKDRALPRAHTEPIVALAFSARADKGLFVISGSHDWTARRWDDLSGIKPVQKTVASGHLASTYALAFAPDDRTLLTAGEDKTLRVWDVADAAPKEKFLLQSPARVYSVAYFPDGKRAVGAGNGSEAQVWDLMSRRLSQPLKGHTHIIVSVAVSPDGQQIMTSSLDKTVRLWEPRFGRELRRFEGYKAPVNAIAYAPDGHLGISASGGYLTDEKGQVVIMNGTYIYTDCNLRQWNLSEGGEPQKYEGHTMTVSAFAVTPDGSELVSGGTDLTLRFWDAASGKEKKMLPLKGYLHSAAYSPDGRYLATAGSESRITVREAVSGKVLHDLELRELPRRLAFAGDSRHLAVTLETGVVYILRLPAKNE
jgi:WD40 repeat protein